MLSALDEGMKNIFGKTTAKAVYYHLQKQYLIRLEDIPERPHAFAKAIKEIFGKTGAEIIETFLVKDLCTKFEIKGQKREVNNIADCMDKLKIRQVEEKVSL